VAIEGGLCKLCKEDINGNLSYPLRGHFTVLTVYIRQFTVQHFHFAGAFEAGVTSIVIATYRTIDPSRAQSTVPLALDST